LFTGQKGAKGASVLLPNASFTLGQRVPERNRRERTPAAPWSGIDPP
jgi:hypothetical protein